MAPYQAAWGSQEGPEERGLGVDQNQGGGKRIPGFRERQVSEAQLGES